MKALSKYEQETIFRYDQEGRMATCFTHDKSLIRKLDNLIEKGEAITLVREGEGWREYRLPKKCIKVRFPRKLSEEQREKLALRMRSTMKKENNDEMAGR